jgi:hypothetical protein
MRKKQKMNFMGIWKWGCLDCTRNIFQQINAKQDLNTHNDRKFQALSEYVVIFIKIVLYWQYNTTNGNVQNLCSDLILGKLWLSQSRRLVRSEKLFDQFFRSFERSSERELVHPYFSLKANSVDE